MIDEDVVRAIALSLPETIERPSYGMAGFRVRECPCLVRRGQQGELR